MTEKRIIINNIEFVLYDDGSGYIDTHETTRCGDYSYQYIELKKDEIPLLLKWISQQLNGFPECEKCGHIEDEI